MGLFGRSLVAALFMVCTVATGIGTAAGQPRIIFDEGHGQRFFIGKQGEMDLSRLAELFASAGIKVTATSGVLDDAALDGVSALCISGAFKPFSPEEVGAVTRFLERGGRMVIMLHIAPPVAPLLSRFGVSHSNGVIQEREGTIEGDPRNFRVTRFSPHPLTAGLERFSVYGAWALLNREANTSDLARSSPTSWVDLNNDRILTEVDAVQSFAVMVAGNIGKGEFVVFGDDALFQNRFLDDDNRRLANNLAAWLIRRLPGASVKL